MQTLLMSLKAFAGIALLLRAEMKVTRFIFIEIRDVNKVINMTSKCYKRSKKILNNKAHVIIASTYSTTQM